MNLVFREDIFIAICGFPEKEIPKGAGFRWDINKKRWWTGDTEKAKKLAKYASDDCLKILAEKEGEKAKIIEMSKKQNSDLEIPKPDGLEYMPFQKAGIEYAQHHAGTLFGDEPGLGKSIEIIGTINLVGSKDSKILLIVPASLRLNWEYELSKWLIFPLSIGFAKENFPETNIIIISYEMVQKFDEQIKKIEWDFLVCDETHKIKSSKSFRTKLILGGMDRDADGNKIKIPAIQAKRKLYATGTPILNRPSELWTLVHSLRPDVFNNWYEFMTRYCGGQNNGYGFDTKGAKNLDELQDKLRATCMVRRLKKDVLTELPAKVRQTVFLDGKSKFTKEYYQELLQTIKNEITEADFKDSKSAEFEAMAKIRKEVGLEKIPFAIDYIKNLMEEVDKLIIFAHHHDVVDGLFAGLSKEFKTVVLTGRNNDIQKDQAVKAFQNGDAKIFIGSIQASGVGLTLTASNTVVFVELDWVPGIMSQAEDRAHRISQRDNVLVQHLVLKNSLDEEISKTLIYKQKIIDQALDIKKGPDQPPESGFSPEYTSENGISNPIIPEGMASYIPAEKISLPNEEKPINQEPEKIFSDKEISIILSMIKAINLSCDGAKKHDGMGFNKFDFRIGESLSRQNFLTQRQAKVAKNLAKKYKNQLKFLFTEDDFAVFN